MSIFRNLKTKIHKKITKTNFENPMRNSTDKPFYYIHAKFWKEEMKMAPVKRFLGNPLF